MKTPDAPLEDDDHPLERLMTALNNVTVQGLRSGMQIGRNQGLEAAAALAEAADQAQLAADIRALKVRQ